MGRVAWKDPPAFWRWKADLPQATIWNCRAPPWNYGWNPVTIDPAITQRFRGVELPTPTTASTTWVKTINVLNDPKAFTWEIRVRFRYADGSTEWLVDAWLNQPNTSHSFEVSATRSGVTWVEYFFTYDQTISANAFGSIDGSAVAV